MKIAAARSGHRYGFAVARSTGGEQGRGGRLAAVLGVVLVLLAAVLYLWGGQLYAHGHNNAQGLCDERNGHLSWQAAVPSGWVCETPDRTLFLGWSPTGVPSDPDSYSTR